MEHLLLEVWQRRRGRTLTLEAYAASGGVEGALARRANSIYGAMSPERQAVARRVLLRLTQPGEGTEDTRRRADAGRADHPPGRGGRGRRRRRRARRGAPADHRARDEATGEPVVDVTHEALIRGWPELRGWINDDREQLRLHRRLSDAAADWDAGGRDDGQLYRGAPLAVWEGRDEIGPQRAGAGVPLRQPRAGGARARDQAQGARASPSGRLAGGARRSSPGIAVFAFVQRDRTRPTSATSPSRASSPASARLQLADRPRAQPPAGRAGIRDGRHAGGRGGAAPGDVRLARPRRVARSHG